MEQELNRGKIGFRKNDTTCFLPSMMSRNCRPSLGNNCQSRDKDDSIVAFLQDFQKMADRMVLQGQRTGLRGRLHSFPPAWLSTQLTGLATLKRARFIKL